MAKLQNKDTEKNKRMPTRHPHSHQEFHNLIFRVFDEQGNVFPDSANVY